MLLLPQRCAHDAEQDLVLRMQSMRPDAQLATSFHSTRAKEPDQHDGRNCLRDYEMFAENKDIPNNFQD